MNTTALQTESLTLVPATLDEVRAQIGGMNAEQKADLSADWLARMESATDANAVWIL